MSTLTSEHKPCQDLFPFSEADLSLVPDIYLVTHGGIKTETDWRLYCIFTFLYGGRGLVFALVSSESSGAVFDYMLISHPS